MPRIGKCRVIQPLNLPRVRVNRLSEDFTRVRVGQAPLHQAGRSVKESHARCWFCVVGYGNSRLGCPAGGGLSICARRTASAPIEENTQPHHFQVGASVGEVQREDAERIESSRQMVREAEAAHHSVKAGRLSAEGRERTKPPQMKAARSRKL